jgi:hypothetical protein
MMQKKILRPDRLRQVPAQFSWLDQRLVRENFLIVADAQGLSYYSEATLSRLLKVDLVTLAQARQQLVRAELLAYHKPLYQVLALPPAAAAPASQRSGQSLSVGDILRRVVQGGAA